MASLYYKEDGEWKPLGVGNVISGRFTVNTANAYSCNFDEPFAGIPRVVAMAVGTQDVAVTGVSENGFVVDIQSGSAPCDIMYLAAYEPGPYDNYTGEELLDDHMDWCTTIVSAAQRVSDYFNTRWDSMSWDYISKMGQSAKAFPDTFGVYKGKTRTVNFGSNGGSVSCRVIDVGVESDGGFTFMATKSLTNHQMNSSNTTSGGWERCAMRSWLNSTVFNGMDASVRNVIKSVNKKNTSGYGAATTSDKLWLLSQTETGLTSGSAEGAKYTSLPNLSSPANGWWLRSVGSSISFCDVSGGSLNSGGASVSGGVVPGFVI